MRRALTFVLLAVFLSSTTVYAKSVVRPKHRRLSIRKTPRKPKSWNPMFPPSRESLIRQNQEIDNLGLSRIKDDAELRTLVASGELVPIPVNSHLKVDPRLPANRRYVRPWTAKFLTDLSDAFYEKFHHPIQVNSAVRPIDVQKKLIRRNRNAAPVDGEAASSHMAGLTIDLQRKGLTAAQVRFIQVRLLILRARDLVEVEEEYFQFCFHIMVSGRYGSEVIPTLTAQVP